MARNALKTNVVRLFAILFSVILAFAMIPAVSFAAPNEGEEQATEQTVEGTAQDTTQDESTDPLAHVSDLDAPAEEADAEATEATDEATELEVEVEQPQQDAVVTEEYSAPEAHAMAKVTVPSVTYQAHSQSYGWMSWAKDGAKAGTTGEGKRLEALRIKVANSSISGGIEYRAHVQGIGWQDWVADGELAGTTGQARRVEAIQIRLTGDLADEYDVYYRVHAQKFGWMGWAKNGASAGSQGCHIRLEAIQIKLVKKGMLFNESTDLAFRSLAVKYTTHVQRQGWQGYVSQGTTSGTTGQGLRLEALKSYLDNTAFEGSIQYRAHVQSYGWLDWVKDGAKGGTTGEGKRMEAVQIKLTGEMADRFDIYYRVHCQQFGWMGWAKNGESAGTQGYGFRMEAIQVKLVIKDGSAPGSTTMPFSKKTDYLNGIDISSWNKGVDISKLSTTDFVIVKVSEGTYYTNPYWEQWADAVLKSGKKLGLYHYAGDRNGAVPSTATAQADFFINKVKKYKGKAVFVLDWEDINNKAFGSGAYSSFPKTFMDRVKSKTGMTCWLYLSQSYAPLYQNLGYPLWVAKYANTYETSGTDYVSSPLFESTIKNIKNAVCYQYSSNGHISGYTDDYNNRVDINKFFGPASLWNQYAKTS